jgi:hypothetical protein
LHKNDISYHYWPFFNREYFSASVLSKIIWLNPSLHDWLEKFKGYITLVLNDCFTYRIIYSINNYYLLSFNWEHFSASAVLSKKNKNKNYYFLFIYLLIKIFFYIINWNLFKGSYNNYWYYRYYTIIIFFFYGKGLSINFIIKYIYILLPIRIKCSCLLQVIIKEVE